MSVRVREEIAFGRCHPNQGRTPQVRTQIRTDGVTTLPQFSRFRGDKEADLGSRLLSVTQRTHRRSTGRHRGFGRPYLETFGGIPTPKHDVPSGRVRGIPPPQKLSLLPDRFMQTGERHLMSINRINIHQTIANVISSEGTHGLQFRETKNRRLDNQSAV